MLWEIQGIVSKGDYLYAVVPDHPKATKNNYVLFHRVLVECYLDRKLTTSEVVHHIDGDSKNNKLDNLALMEYRDHVRWHGAQNNRRTLVRLLCPTCQREFVLPKRKTHLNDKNRSFTSCSKSCGTKFSYETRKGEALYVENAIKQNVIEIFLENTPIKKPHSILETHKPQENMRQLWQLCDLQKKRKTFATQEKTKRQKKLNKECQLCGSVFTTKSGTAQYCSRECSSKSTRKVEWPDKETLEKLVWEYPTNQLAKKFGVSDVAVAKWCKKLGVGKPPRGYWAKQKE